MTCDSVQVYRGLDIGSAKPTRGEQRGVRHHLIDVVAPTEAFNVSQWLGLAEAAVRDIQGRGVTPIVVGGTHLYVKAFLEGLFQGPEPDAALRVALWGISQGERRAELERVDPVAAGRIHSNDERRTVRALEVYRLTGGPISGLQRQWDRAESLRPGCVLVGLVWAPDVLRERIEARVDEMVGLGLVEEVRGLYQEGRLGPQAGGALGYGQIVRYILGTCTLDGAVGEIKAETKRLAKNQRTWLRRMRGIADSVWIETGETARGQWSEIVLGACVAGSGPT